MDQYTYILDQLRDDDFRRLRAFADEGRGKFTTWLVVVGRRLCVDHHRKKYGRPQARRESEVAESGEQTARRNLLDLIADEIDIERLEDESSLRPDAEVLSGERRRVLEAAVSTLDLADQLLLTLRFEEGLPVRKIAPIIGFQTRFQVHRRLNAVLAQLRQALEEHGITEP